MWFSPVDITLWLGDITEDSDGRITGAKATTLTFFIKNQGVFDKGEAREVGHVVVSDLVLGFTVLSCS